MSKSSVMEVLAKGGFSFDLCRRNAMLQQQGAKLPKFSKTGTTIVNLIYKMLSFWEPILKRLKERLFATRTVRRFSTWCQTSRAVERVPRPIQNMSKGAKSVLSMRKPFDTIGTTFSNLSSTKTQHKLDLLKQLMPYLLKSK